MRRSTAEINGGLGLEGRAHAEANRHNNGEPASLESDSGGLHPVLSQSDVLL